MIQIKIHDNIQIVLSTTHIDHPTYSNIIIKISALFPLLGGSVLHPLLLHELHPNQNQIINRHHFQSQGTPFSNSNVQIEVVLPYQCPIEFTHPTHILLLAKQATQLPATKRVAWLDRKCIELSLRGWVNFMRSNNETGTKSSFIVRLFTKQSP